jgi:hypothetical protein
MKLHILRIPPAPSSLQTGVDKNEFSFWASQDFKAVPSRPSEDLKQPGCATTSYKLAVAVWKESILVYPVITTEYGKW